MEDKDIEIGKTYGYTQFEGEVTYHVKVVYERKREFLCVLLDTGQAFYATASRLSPHNPYADFKIDEPVMVRNTFDCNWNRRHFAGVGKDGEALTWDARGTSWSSRLGDTTQWDECRRPTEEELQKKKGGGA